MRNLFTQLFKQLVSVNQTNDTQSRDYRNGVMSWLSAGHLLCATHNRGTTPPIHHTPYTIHRSLRYAAMVTLLLTLACGQMWGTDFDITVDQIRVLPTRAGLVKLTNGSNCTTSSGKLQIANGATGSFTIAATESSTYKIKSIVFTVNRNVTGFTCTSGGSLSGSNKSWNFTPTSSTPTGSATFSLNNTSGGAAQITFVVTMTTAETITVEQLHTFSSLSAGVYSFTSSAGTTQIDLTDVGTNAGSVSSNLISFGKSSSKSYGLKVAAKSGYNLKFVSLYTYDCSQDPKVSSDVSTYTKASYTWIPSSTATNVTLTFDTENAHNIKIYKIFVGYEAAASSCSDETGLAYGTGTVNKVYGDASFTNTLTNPNSLSVTYSSDDTDVATVNESTGAVTIVGAGSTTIRASWAGNSTYCEDEVSYTLNVKPAVGSVSGRWDRFGGETISLSVTPSGGSSYTYQWQKWYDSKWNNVSNGTSAGVVTSGATTDNLQIANCTYENSGSYRCVVTSAGQTNETDGRQVKVYVLECYNGGTTVYNFTRTGSSQAGTLTIDLSASTAYTFKVHADNDYYGNNGTINEDETNWVLCNNSNVACTTNLTVNSGLGGTFTFSMDYSTSGSSSVEGEPEISVTYPRKRIYLSPDVWDADGAKFAYHYYRTSGGSGWTDFLTEDDCGMYADIPQWNGVVLIPARLKSSTVSPGSWDDRWNQTNDITVTSNDYVTITGWNASDFTYGTYSAPTYTISYNKGSTTYTGGNSISGSKSDETKTCGTDFTLPSSAVFTTTGYTQDGWATSDGGSKAYNLGGTYSTESAQTFYPHWSVNSYNLTWDLAGGTTTSAGTGIASGVSSTTTTSQNYGTSLTAPSVSKTGYNFSAWSPSVASTMPAANTTYTATWAAETYDVTTSLTNVTVSSGTTGEDAATYNTAYSVTLAGATGYNLPATVTVMRGATNITANCTWTQGTGVLNIPAAQVTGDITITATGVAKTYSITLDDNGGSADGGATATYLSTSLSSISAPTYSGHTVDGYYTSANCTTKVATGAGALQASITVDEVAWTNSSSQWIKDGTAKFYAHWKCNTPTITDNGDNTISITVPSGTTVRYTTDGTTPSSSTGTVYSEAFAIAEDVTVKAIAYQSGCTDSEVASADCEYTATYTVTYAYNGATGGDGTESATAASVTLPSPTKTGYTFDGWYTTAGTEVGDGGDTYNPTADITLYARWQESCAAGGYSNVYSMTLSGTNGKTDVTITQSTADVASITTVLDDSEPINKSGDKYFKFGSSSAISITYTFAVGDKLVFDVCSKDDNKSCGVSVKVGSADAVDVTGTLMQTPSTLNYTITSAGSTTVVIKRAGDNASSMRLHGIAIQRSGGGGTCYHVYYHGNGATSGFISDPGAYASGDDPTVLDYDDGSYPLVNAGYTFQGWATAEDGDVAYSAGDNIEDIADDVDLYAIWEEVVPCTAAPTVTAGSNSSVTSTTATVTCADGISSLGTGGCTITSYGFVIGTSANPTLSDTQHEVGTSYASTGTSFSKNLTGLTANTTYYVRAYATNGYGTAYGTQTSFTTLATYTVTYAGNGNTDGSEPSDASSPYESGSTVKVKDEGTLVKTDYVFAGWNTAADGSGTWYCPNASFEISANTTLNAQWVEAADIECATLYTVTNIAPKAAGTLNSTGGYFSGISSNGMFTALGDVSKTDNAGGAPEMKTISSTTVGGTAFTSAIYLKRAANISSYLPTSHAIKFEIPSAGILDLYVKRSDRLKLIKSGSTTPISVGSSDQDIKESIAVTAGTWYLYANNTNTALYGMKLTCCTDPGLAYATDEVSKTVGDADFTNTLTNTYGVTVSYESSDEYVATVASDGEVTIVGAGTCTITASAEAQTVSTVDYCADDASYTLTVSLPTYTVTYNTNDKTSGSAPSDASSPYESGSTVTVLNNTGSLARTGYVFLGWSTSYGGGTAYAPGETFTITGNTNLYPIWAEGTSATITYALNVGTSAGTEIKSSATADNANITDIDIDQTNDGADGAGASNRTTVLAIKTGANGADWSGDPTNYEIFEYTVADGYVFTPSDVTIKIANKGSSSANNIKYKAVLSDGTHSISTTYICTTENGTVETFHMYNKSAVAFEGDVTLKLWAWTIADKSGGGDGFRMGTPLTITGAVLSTGYIISFAGNGETSGSTASVTGITSGSDVNQITANGFTKNGYTFDGWKTNTALTYVPYGKEDTEGNRVAVAINGTVPDKAKIKNVTSNITLTAQWTPNDYTITYHLNGASWAGGYSAPDEYTVGTGATLPISSNMTNTGYTFAGWKNNSSLTGDTYTSVSTSDYGNKEFWAKWTENTYDVTYNANGGSGTTAAQNGHYVTLRDNGFTAPSGKTFVEWNTATDGSGASYNEGEEVELTADLALYAIWANDYTITWGDVQLGGSGDAVTPNLGGGNYTITASVADWTGTLASSMISTLTDGVTITNVAVDNSSSPKTITATFGVGASVEGTSITLVLNVPAAGSYGTKSSSKEITIDRCTGSSSGSDGVLFSAEFKDSGLGTSNICAAANTPYTFTTTELKSAPTGGSIKAYTTDNLGHMKFATNAISIAGSNGVIQIDLDNAIQTYDLFTYVNVNSSSSSAYLRHTSADNTTDQIALTVYNSKEVKVMLPAGYNGKTTLYLVRNTNNFNLHKAAVVRPAFLMLLRDDTPTSDTNLEGTDAELTTGNYLTTIQGGRAYYTSPSSGNLKIKRSSSKNYINFNNAAGYVKIVLNDALQEGDVIGFDSYNTNNLALTTTATRSTSIVTTNQLYTVDGSSALKGATTFYIWQNSGSSDYLRGLQIARSGAAGGGGGTDQITPTLTWESDLPGGVETETGAADFTHTVTQDKNSLGAITYASSNTSVVTVNATSGKVHVVGAGDATITATIAESGCYEEATAEYDIHVEDNCADIAGTIGTEDLGCSGIRMTVTGHTAAAGVTYQWYKDGESLGSAAGAQTASYTASAAGEYYVIVTNSGSGHCSKASTNTITVEAMESATASKIVDEWYVKNGRRTPDIALIQTENADNFQVKSGETVIWDTKTSVTTGFAGCSFYLGTDGIIYLMGQQPDGSEPSGLTAGNETLTFIAKACGGDADGLDITIRKQASTTYPSVAYVSLGTEKGAVTDTTAGYYKTAPLYKYLDHTLSGGAFDLTARNIYWSVDEKELREHYSQFDAILITDDPNTGKKKDGTSYVDAMGALIDIRPMLTMEAWVSGLANWKAKGINGNPSSPNPRQYAMKLDCKNHEIFQGISSSSSNVEVETIDGVDYWTVTMVDSTMSPYSDVAYNAETDKKPALQGFSASDVSDLLLLGEISEGTLYAGVERQEEPAARLMLLGLNAKALPNALTPEGKKIIENALSYLIETDMEKVDDCSNYFTGATDTDWNTPANWSKGEVPNSPYVRARILSPCVVNSGTFKVASIDIATSGKSINKAGTINGSLTINAGAALVVGGQVRAAEAPYFNKGDLMPTETADLVLNTNVSNQSALVFNNDDGDTKATVNLYSKGRKDGSAYQFQYLAVPMNYIDVNPAFAGSGIYTYVWHEESGWERRGYYTGLEAFEGVGITTKSASASSYTMQGALTATTEKDITLSNETNGQNIVGNSWTAPIDIASLSSALVDDANIVDKTIYIYCTGNDKADGNDDVDSASTETPGQWLAIPIEAAAWGAWSGLKVIPAMQAFCIKANAETTLTLNYKDHVRSTASAQLNQYLRAPKRRSEAETDGIDLIRIRVADSKTHTDLYLFEGEPFSEEFDNGWEAKYMSGDGRSAKLYAESTIGQLAVAAQPEYEGTVLGFAPGQETEYTFTFSGPNKDYYLNDLKLKKSTLISEDESYYFTFEEGDTNRFYISKTRIDAPAITTGTENTGDGAKAKKVIVNDKLYIILNGRVFSAEGIMVK